jgi:gluconate 2-dehydrogenase
MIKKPRILITRAIFPEVIAKLAQHFEVESNQADAVWSPTELIARMQGKQGIFSFGVERIDPALLTVCPDLKICANMTVGYNNFDLDAMTAAGVLGTNAPDVLTETTADFGFALLMATARRVAEAEHFLRAGLWTRWSFDMFAGADIHGSTLGILGMGRIGQGIARRGALGFGMRVIYHNRSQLAPALERECQAAYVSKAELLATADHLVLVLPYSAESHHTIGTAELAQMKPTATLINIARGGIVDDAALALALRNKTIAAAGLDVFEGEPTVHPDLLSVPNVVLTPHIASASIPTRLAMAHLAADNLIEFFENQKALTPLNMPRSVDWDPTMLTQVVGDNPAMHRRLLDRYIANAREQMAAIALASAAGEPHAVGELAHKLKSSSRSVGALFLGELCQKLEAAGSAADAQACSVLMEPLSAAFAVVGEKIKQV